MVIGALGKQAPTGAQQCGESFVRLEHLNTRHVGDLVKESTSIVHRNDDRDSRLCAGDLVVLAIGRCLVDNPCSLTRGDILRDKNLPGVLHAPGLTVGVVIKNLGVFDAAKVRALNASGDRRDRIRDLGVSEFLAVVADGVLGHQVGDTGVRSLWSCRDQCIGDVWSHGESRVGGERPRRGGPRECEDSVEVCSCGLIPVQREGHRDGLVLTRFVDVVVHS